MSPAVLELVDVSKRFRTSWSWRVVRAVESLSVALNQGEVFGLIGHNGAGKTTTFKLLVGLLRPTRGLLLWNGRRLGWGRQRTGIGFSPEQPYFYDYLTVQETLQLYGHLYGMPGDVRRRRIRELADILGIGKKLDTSMRALSKGTLQRVAIAQAILHRPQLAILDEPMSGLDPVGRKQMRDVIGSLREEGTTVLFSSHILSDAEALCDRVGILAAGRLREVVALGSGNGEPRAYRLTVAGDGEAVAGAVAGCALGAPTGGPERWVVTLPDQVAVQAALARLHGNARIEALVPEYPSLEQRFLQYVPDGADGD